MLCLHRFMSIPPTKQFSKCRSSCSHAQGFIHIHICNGGFYWGFLQLIQKQNQEHRPRQFENKAFFFNTWLYGSWVVIMVFLLDVIVNIAFDMKSSRSKVFQWDTVLFHSLVYLVFLSSQCFFFFPLIYCLQLDVMLK